jgi:hypothetical protein
MHGSVDEQLRQYAERLAEAQQHRIITLEKEMLEAEERKAAAKADLENVKSAITRLDTFQTKKGTRYQCPYCWISRGEAANIRPVPSPPSIDLFVCNVCNQEITIE